MTPELAIPKRDRSTTSFSTRLLLAWLLFVVVATLSPFNFGPAGATEGREFTLSGSNQDNPIHVILNMLLFMPVGALLHHEGRRRSVRLLRTIVVTGAAAFLISFTLELLQRFLPSREASLIDIVANTTGAWIGIFADRTCRASAAVRTWEASIAARTSILRPKTSPMLLVSVIAGFMLVTLLTSWALQSRARLSNWSLDYPLAIGNEATGDRPWKGNVFALAITDAPTPLASMRRFSAGELVELPGSWMAAYDFTKNPPYRDEAGHLPDLDWTETPRQPGNIGATLTGHPWLRTGRSAAELARRLRETNSFTLRIQCATRDIGQKGPARIVSNSVSPFLRNFTVGQQGDDLVFRLRTPQTGLNGRAETIVPGVFSSNQHRDILITYDGATLLTAIAHDYRVFRTEMTPGSGAALALPLIIRANELPMYKFIYLAALFLPPGVLIGFLGRTRLERLVLSVVYLLAASILLEGTLVLASGRAFDWHNVAGAAGVGAVVLSLLGLTVYQPDLPRRQESTSLHAAETFG